MGDWDALEVGDCFVASLLAMTMPGKARDERTTERADEDVCRANRAHGERTTERADRDVCRAREDGSQPSLG